ncbi:MAG: 3-hydroxyisobutyrate dehydrogenase [Pseudomonadota bacterium]
MTSIAFIGLGNMGGPMAANLVKAGYDVAVFDLSAEAVAQAVEAGATARGSVGEAVKVADVVVSMLPAGPHVEKVYLGEGGVLSEAPSTALLIDSSTIDVDTARRVSEAATGKGFAFVDAPVSGGVAAAAAGGLTFMVGGEAAAFDRAKPILDAMGKNIFHAGAAGNGQVAKICNNMVLGISMIAVSEAFNLADSLGLDRQKLFDISSTASGQCWSMTSYCPAPGLVETAPSNREYQPGFAAGMMLKDLRLAQEAAQSARAATPLGSEATAIYTLMEAAGKDGLDFSGVYKLIAGSLK